MCYVDGVKTSPRDERTKKVIQGVGCIASAVEAFLVQFPGCGSNIITLLNYRHLTLLEALQWLSVDSGVYPRYLAILRWYNQSKTLFCGVYPRQNPKFVHYITLEGQCSFSGYPRYLGRPSVVSAFKNYSTPAQSNNEIIELGSQCSELTKRFKPCELLLSVIYCLTFCTPTMFSHRAFWRAAEDNWYFFGPLGF